MMSNTLFLDDKNGNSLIAINRTTATTSNSFNPTINSNEINICINNNNNNNNNNNLIGSTNKISNYTNNSTELTASLSNEDLSQSLSEYTDADESMSAPTEFLAEFLSAVMLKDYETALEYCELILRYEPENATAKEFYPLIKQKIEEGDFSTEDEDLASDDEKDHNASESANISKSKIPLRDNQNNDEDESNTSESADGNNSDNNTTHSYSSLLLEDEDDETDNDDDVDVPISRNSKDHVIPQNLDVANGNVKAAAFSDSESPSEPLTQRLAAMFRSKYAPGENK